MSLQTEAGQPVALAQLSEAVKTATAAVPASEPALRLEKARPVPGLSLVRSTGSKYWERIECWQDTARPFAVESALNKSRHETPEIISAFGSNLPPASTFLLHYGPKWKTNKGKVVVLSHGASDNANRAWATPAILLGDASAPGLRRGAVLPL